MLDLAKEFSLLGFLEETEEDTVTYVMDFPDDVYVTVTDDNGSYAEDSFKSSSSISDRLDIDYRDTLTAGDTMNFYMELATWDTVTIKGKKDSTGKYTLKIIGEAFNAEQKFFILN